MKRSNPFQQMSHDWFCTLSKIEKIIYIHSILAAVLYSFIQMPFIILSNFSEILKSTLYLSRLFSLQSPSLWVSHISHFQSFFSY